MKKIKFLVIAAITAVLMSACGTSQTVPLTGRKHNLRVTDQQVLSLSSQEYTKYMASAKKSTNSANFCRRNLSQEQWFCFRNQQFLLGIQPCAE